MKYVKRGYVKKSKEYFIEQIKEGKIFIYPTDTIYGIGCSALSPAAIRIIRAIKERTKQPFSIIAPSREWIYEHCEVQEYAQEWIDRLPGPYTFLLKRKDTQGVSSEVHHGMDTLGVRMPKHWFCDVIEESGVPFITTSVNLKGHPHARDVSDITLEILKDVDFVVDEGAISGEPSMIVDLSGDKEEIIRPRSS